MQTRLAAALRDSPQAAEAATLLGRCVHCGFCNATCPTYRLLGDELDSPRGRLYLVKQVLEGIAPTARTQLHLDRCLTCRGCETTCPSGVQYGRIIDAGRSLVDRRVTRPPGAQLRRLALRTLLPSRLFPLAVRFGQAVRPLLPAAIRDSLPPRQRVGAWPRRTHARKVLLLAGCVQPSLAPNINVATARVLDRLGIEVVVPRAAGCCGAIRYHLDDGEGGLDDARRNIDAWWPTIEAGAEAVVMNASGCGAMVKDYGHLLRGDVAYAARAERISGMTRDLAELLAGCVPLLRQRMTGSARRVAVHSPCTLQHGQQLRGVAEELLASLGAEVLPVADGHSCCGSAGTYSLLQPALSRQLRDRKRDALMAGRPEMILSANIGCIAHLAPAAPVPVRHWVEWLDEELTGA